MAQDCSIIKDIKRQERRRCEALVAADLSTLRELLAEDLIHVHTRGNSDNLESYLEYVSTIIAFDKVIREDDMKIHIYGNTAVMTGTQINHAYMRAKPETRAVVRSRVMQVWVRNNACWQLVAFQATPMSAPPPVVPR